MEEIVKDKKDSSLELPCNKEGRRRENGDEMKNRRKRRKDKE